MEPLNQEHHLRQETYQYSCIMITDIMVGALLQQNSNTSRLNTSLQESLSTLPDSASTDALQYNIILILSRLLHSRLWLVQLFSNV